MIAFYPAVSSPGCVKAPEWSGTGFLLNGMKQRGRDKSCTVGQHSTAFFPIVRLSHSVHPLFHYASVIVFYEALQYNIHRDHISFQNIKCLNIS